jgi:hypothetical protein
MEFQRSKSISGILHTSFLLRTKLPLALTAAALCTLTANAQKPADTTTATYTTKIQPILQKNCYGCHSASMRGGLRLDSLDDLLKGGSSGPVIVPGHPESSMLLSAIRYKDPDLQMPPKGPLPDSDVATIEAWIRDSATDLAAEAAPQPTLKPVSGHSLPAPILSEQDQYFETKVRPLLIAKCFACHSAQHTGGPAGGLGLDSRNGVMKGGLDGAVIDVAHPEASRLLTAVHYTDTRLKMPPSGQLEPAELAVLEQWVRDGVAWPASQHTILTSTVTDKDRSWWAYQKPVAPPIPTTTSKWAYNDIDRFVLAKLDEQHLTPVRDADKRTLIRRVTFDVTGLPPTPAEIAAFLADKSPDAYTKLVDRLLASKAYGERWGRIWLDVVRYSDTSGDGADYPVPDIYKYRDYVIKSIADDKPYNRFIQEQIAGDLLPAQTEPEHWQNIIATGYLANSNHTEDPVSDALDNIGYAYLGTTVACARCHDHKFDPVPTADYYAMYGILASSKYSQTGWEEVRYQRNLIYRDPHAQQSQQYKDFEAQLKPVADSIAAVNLLPFFDDVLPALQARRMALFQHEPHFETAYGVVEGTPHDENIQHLGDKKNLGDVVPRHFLQVLGNWQLPADTKGSGRLQLANWIASPDNPLTARVMVNRLWQGHFGRGIVATPNDYGKRGSPPSNQPLLDYLATQFVQKGWSLKAIHRMILLSHAYRLSSEDSEAAEKIDPENIYLWRHSRARMDAEEIRDSMLATSGTLDTTPAGPQPFPAEGDWNYSGHAPFHAVYETNRRTLYVMVQRTRRHPYLGLFDGANPAVSVALRDTSVTPLQALYFLNAAFPKNCATALAKHLQDTYPSEKDQIRSAFLSIYARPPDKIETDHATGFLAQVTAIYLAHADTTTPQPTEAALKLAHQRALGNFIQALYASNEFIFID